jgi:glycosyltransferase involved in cell wall biosynthesis
VKIRSNNKNIFVIVPSLKSGGAERFVSNLINSIESKHIIHLIILDSRYSAFEILNKKTLIVERLVFRKVIYSMPFLLKKIIAVKPDLIFTTLGNLNLYISILKFLLQFKFKFKLVIRPILLASNEKYTGIVSKFNYYLNFIFLRYADRIVCQSIDMKNDYINCYPSLESKIIVINNMIDPKIEKIRQIKHPQFERNNPIKLIAVGRLEYQKGFDILIESCSYITEVPFELRIFGSGNLYKSLLNRIFELGLENHVFLMGSVDNIYNEYLIADYFVLSSRYEGFPNVLIEALSLGLPSIVMPSPGGINEIMSTNFSFGSVASGITPKDLAKSILDEIRKPYKRVAFDATNKYTAKSISDQYINVFDEVFN